jgi:indole-3-glycerol phosphate synthase
MNILDEIFANKRLEVERQKQLKPLEGLRVQTELLAPPIDFIDALRQASYGRHTHHPALIAEVKCASPSRGVLAPAFDPLGLARLYVENGAAAISVLTDERYFKGHLNHLRQIASEIKDHQPSGRQVPLLRKDFIFDPYQVYEARLAGADAILLIVAALEPVRLFQLQALAHHLGMVALIEIHNRAELDVALDCGPLLLGINNRNLKDFTVDLETSLHLRTLIPDEVCLVSESGIHTPEDVSLLAKAGIDAILVGEALVTAPDVATQVRSLAQLPRIGL